MTLLIDGYNLMYAAHIVGSQTGKRGLHSSRLAMLRILEQRLSPEEAARTTVVFDAAEAPPGLPREQTLFGIHVHFAPSPGDADALLEDLILADSAPRSLTVVSSDHRVQRAAKRRRGIAVDSDVWFRELVHRQPAESTQPLPDKPVASADAAEVAYWLKQFGEGGKPLPEVIYDSPFPPEYFTDPLPDDDEPPKRRKKS